MISAKLLQKEQSSWNTRLSQADGFFRSLPKGRGRGLLPFAELLEGRPDDAAALHHAVPAHPHVRQVPADDAVIHNDCLQKDTQLNPLPLPPAVHLLHKLMRGPGTPARFPYFRDEILSVKRKVTTKQKCRRLEPPIALLVMPASITDQA